MKSPTLRGLNIGAWETGKEVDWGQERPEKGGIWLMFSEVKEVVR